MAENFNYIRMKFKLCNNDWRWLGVNNLRNVDKYTGGAHLKLNRYILLVEGYITDGFIK